MYEYFVQIEAWKRGAEVFRNAGSTGPIDLILVWEGKTLRCDVKSMDWNVPQNRYLHRRPHMLANDVQLISVNPQTNEISFPPNRTPAGWENFWS